jgi:predicted O-methyltransferase YrrM
MSKPTFLNQNLYEYMVNHSVRHNPYVEEGNAIADTQIGVSMQSAIEELNFLGWFAKTINAKNIIEVGTFNGLSALVLAQNTPVNAKVICIDHCQNFSEHAKALWQKANVADKIEFHLGKGLEVMKQLQEQLSAESIDLIFLDADKENYLLYYELALPLIRSGGIIMIDNVLWKGTVIDQSDQRPTTTGIRKLNAMLVNDNRVDITMLPIGDGLTLARKL